ncbi:hypothetical protein [Senegalimassilia anaerobia]|uniref:hypothetical protein n=1 Tax=Senegalimassilia anaerobia TaxID=1473216 RepID=UPI003A8EFDC6
MSGEYDISKLILKVFGSEIQIGLADIEDDPRWPIPSVGLIEAEKWVAGPFASAPLVVRRLDSGKYAPVSPMRSFAARKALIEVSEETALTVHVCEGLPAEDAVAVHEAVEWYVEPEHSGDWIRRYRPARTELERFNGRHWLKEGCCRFMAAACGTNTSELNKIKNVCLDGEPEVIALVEEGLLSIRAANDATDIPAEKQREAVKKIREKGIKESRDAAKVIHRFAPPKIRSVGKLVSDVDNLVDAVFEGRVSIGVQEALRLQVAVGNLVRAACERK